MENNINRKNRLVIPKWRLFERTKLLGELSGIGDRKIEFSENEFKKKKDMWKQKKDFLSAMELLIYDGFEDKDVQDAIDYIKLNNYANIASGIISENVETNIREIENNIRISKLKKSLEYYPRNAIYWVDLSLCYTVINQEEKAIKAMKIALQLDFNNRFVIRAAVRLFLHYNKSEYAYYILKKSELKNYDPWINASYISVSQLLGKKINNINTSKSFIECGNFSKFDISELSCSIGSLELSNGKDKEAKKMFRESIIEPNDNVAAQLQWISKNIIKISEIEQIDKENIKNNFEYETIEKCYLEKFEEAVQCAEKWMNDDMISTIPILVAASIYASIFEDYEKSEKIVNEGLKREKNNIKLKIQLAYCKINKGELEEAEEILNILEKENLNIENKIFVLADKGMINFRKGNEEIGELYYRDAINLAGKNQMMQLKATALFHLSKEKFKINSSTFLKSLSEAKEFFKYIKDPLTLYNIKKFRNIIN